MRRFGQYHPTVGTERIFPLLNSVARSSSRFPFFLSTQGGVMGSFFLPLAFFSYLKLNYFFAKGF